MKSEIDRINDELALAGESPSAVCEPDDWKEAETARPVSTSQRSFPQLVNDAPDFITQAAPATADEQPDASPREKDHEIPAGVFPVPAGGITYTASAKIIFSTIARKKRVFTRGTSPHEVATGPDGADYLTPLTSERLSNIVETYGHRVARREKGTGKDEGLLVWRSTTFPQSAAKVILQSDMAREHLPAIASLSGCPILTPDGEILSRGYHPHNGGVFITHGDRVEIVGLEVAKNAIVDLLDDFHFATPSDKSRALASLISPALKMGGHLLDDFPLDVAEADLSQSGKTYRLNVICRLYGEHPTTITAPKGGVGGIDEAIATALIRGRPFIQLGNIRGRIDSAIMEEAIRGSGLLTCRALRVSAEVNTRPFLWQLSTNGAELTRDLANRSIITRIRKRQDSYVFRRFPEGDLLSHVAARRPFYLGAVFTIIREWIGAGRPRSAENRHDFREWIRVLDWIIQEILQHPPLLDGHREEQGRVGNPALQWLRDVCHATNSARQLCRELSTSELVSIADDGGVDFPGNSASREEPMQRAGKIIGRLFRESEGKALTVDGYVVTRRIGITYENGPKEHKFYTITQP
jgi:hypothetical protein